jgi:hypothetical protein
VRAGLAGGSIGRGRLGKQKVTKAAKKVKS